jgi:hypothetical protein
VKSTLLEKKKTAMKNLSSPQWTSHCPTHHRKDACQGKQKYGPNSDFKAVVDKAKFWTEVVSEVPGKQVPRDSGRTVKGRSRE